MATPGWYKDPNDPTRARWHDGEMLTQHSIVMADHSSPPPDPTGPRPAFDSESIAQPQLVDKHAEGAPIQGSGPIMASIGYSLADAEQRSTHAAGDTETSRPEGQRTGWTGRNGLVFSAIFLVITIVGLLVIIHQRTEIRGLRSDLAYSRGQTQTARADRDEALAGAATPSDSRDVATTTVPTTVVPQSPAQVQSGFAATFSGSRASTAAMLQDDENVQTLDELTYDAGSGTVRVGVTSQWASPDNQHNGAWEITRSMATLWSRDGGAWFDALWQPAFRLTNSGRTYTCSADVMTRLGSLDAGRDVWEAEC